MRRQAESIRPPAVIHAVIEDRRKRACKGRGIMNTMSFIVWMQPVIFMIHDFEEIIMAEAWTKRYRKEIDAAWPKRQPFGINYIRYFQTPTLSVGVGVEFLIFTGISLLSAAVQNYFVWFGVFLGITLHLVFVHLLLPVKFKHYVPGVITSAVLIVPSVWLLFRSASLLRYGAGTVLSACLLGIALVAVGIPFLHRAMGSWSEMLYKYSTGQKR